jgi:hypothetical protein
MRGAFVRKAKLGEFCFKTWDFVLSKDLAFGTERAQEATLGFLGWMDGALWRGSAIVIVFSLGTRWSEAYLAVDIPLLILSIVARIESIEDFSSKIFPSPIRSEPTTVIQKCYFHLGRRKAMRWGVEKTMAGMEGSPVHSWHWAARAPLLHSQPLHHTQNLALPVSAALLSKKESWTPSHPIH